MNELSRHLSPCRQPNAPSPGDTAVRDDRCPSWTDAGRPDRGREVFQPPRPGGDPNATQTARGGGELGSRDVSCTSCSLHEVQDKVDVVQGWIFSKAMDISSSVGRERLRVGGAGAGSCTKACHKLRIELPLLM